MARTALRLCLTPIFVSILNVLSPVSTAHAQVAPQSAQAELATLEAAFEKAKADRTVNPGMVVDLAEAYEKAGKFDKAIGLYETLLEAFRDAAKQGNEGAAAIVKELEGKVATLRSKAPAKNPAAEAEEKLLGAMVLGANGAYAEALELFDRHLPEREQGAQDAMLAQLLQMGSLIQDVMGRPDRGEVLMNRSIALYEKLLGGDGRGLVEPLRALALHHVFVHDDDKARATLERALRIAERHEPDGPLTGHVLESLARSYASDRDFARAEAAARRALSIAEQTEPRSIPNVLQTLGSIHTDQGKYDLAETELLKVLSLEEAQGRESFSLVGVLAELGALYEGKHDWASAERYLERRRVIVERVMPPDHLAVATALCTLGELYWVKGDMVRAFPLGKRCADIREKNLANILARGSEKQKQAYVTTFLDERDIFISYHAITNPNDAEAAKLALSVVVRRKGRVLDAMADSLATLRGRMSDGDKSLLDQLDKVRGELAALSLRGAGKQSPEQFKQRVAELEERARKLEAEVSSHSAEFKVQTLPIDTDSVQAALLDGTALLEIVSYRPFNRAFKSNADRYGPPRYAAYVLGKTGAPRYADLGETAPIDANVAKLRAALADPARADAKSLSQALYAQVMRPVRPLLAGTTRVFVSPDGALNLVPFGALADEKGKWLVEDLETTVLTSGRDLLRLATATPAKGEPIVLADPKFDEGSGSAASSARRSVDFTKARFSPLPGTAEEAEAIKKTLPSVRVLTGAEATEGELKRVAAPRILHVATHGFFLADQPVDRHGRRGLELEAATSGGTPIENPLLRSGLALAGANQRSSGGEDGVLTALEAASLNLGGTKLVVLSACETGVGDAKSGDGVYGLRRAFAIAGAESQLFSMWKVDDQATKDLMVGFYGKLVAGEGRSAALRSVQLSMLAEKATEHPYFWASFVPSGDPRPLDFSRPGGDRPEPDDDDDGSSWTDYLPFLDLTAGVGFHGMDAAPGWNERAVTTFRASANMSFLSTWILRGEGFVLRDEAFAEIGTGADTTARAVGYWAALGVRGDEWGLMAGARLRYDDVTIDRVTGRALTLPILLRLETPWISDSALHVNGWALETIDTGNSLGVDVTMTGMGVPVFITGGYEVTDGPMDLETRITSDSTRVPRSVGWISLGLDVNGLLR